MDQATHSVPAGFVWPTVGHPGRVPLWALVGDPNQPRKNFDDDELDALASTMRAENGGEQREIITVCALNTEEQIEYPLPVRYMIVSGERRWRAAHRAGLPDVEIRVKSYKNRAERKLDMFMLNNGRVGLSDIENAWYLAELMEDFDVTTGEELARLTGESLSWVTQHLALLNLSPKARALMDPKIPEYERLKRGVGVFLARFNFVQQDIFVEGMPKGRATGTQQIRWMRDQLKGTENEPPRPKFKPGTIRQITKYFADQIERRTGELLAIETLDKIFENASSDQVNELMGKLQDARAEFGDFVDRVAALSTKANVSKLLPAPKPVAPVPAPKPPPQDTKAAAAAFAQKRQEVKPPAPAAREVHTPEQRPAPRPASHYAPPRPYNGGMASKRAPAPSVIGGPGKEKAVTFMGPNGRLVTDKVSQRKYLELWDSKQLGFQIKGTERPEWMPTKEGAKEDWDKYCE